MGVGREGDVVGMEPVGASDGPKVVGKLVGKKVGGAFGFGWFRLRRLGFFGTLRLFFFWFLGFLS